MGLSMDLRVTGCVLGGDNLAISGAPDPEQLAAVDLSVDEPALITIQVGANDIGFDQCIRHQILDSHLGFIRKCVDERHGEPALDRRVRRRLEMFAASLGDILNYLRTAAPNARIAVLNYYQIAPAPDVALVADGTLVCSIAGLGGMQPDERRQLRADALFLQLELNSTIATVVEATPGVELIDVSQVFEGEELCTAGSKIFSDTWRAAHPTSEGHEEIATAVATALQD
jgi:lysophospholipase L1-like esterase